ncbi:MAG: hypothetical protein BAJATHORv1_30178 [Candidatus Thorarchaeota archaeon]|nr:MAG: hypothetical protein BAJATHORv1_30178 [Candidatus Thorarchaeota archaeon]
MERTDKYRKDQEQENILEKINRILEPLEIKEIQRFDSPLKKTLFIIGPPRGATTLLHQLVAETGVFGYISNYLARFWAAPYIGALQEKALNIRTKKDMSYQSDYGRTSGWYEPHQFNYFWKKWYRYDEDHQMKSEIIDCIDQVVFRQEIAALESVFEAPMVFKSLYCGLQIPFLRRTLKKSKFVICTRDPLYQAQSILLGRKAFFGDYSGWFSLKPPEYYELVKKSPYEQVAGQVYYILKAIGNAIADLSATEYVIIDHSDLIGNPHAQIRSVLQLAGLSATEEIMNRIPESFENRNRQTITDTEWEKLKSAVESWFSGRDSIDILLE